MDAKEPVEVIDCMLELVERRTNPNGTITHVLRQPAGTKPWTVMRCSPNVLAVEIEPGLHVETWNIKVTTRTAIETFDIEVLAQAPADYVHPSQARTDKAPEIDYMAITHAVSGAIH